MGTPALARASERPKSASGDTAASASIVIEWIRRPEGIEPLAEAWRALEASVQQRTVLSTFDYNATWYKYYAGPGGADALIGIARRGSALVGVAPLVIRRRRIGKMPLTCIEFAAHE